MPLYTYECECGLRFDKLGSYADVFAVCVECEDEAIRLPFYSGQNTVGEATVPTSEREYTIEAEKRALKGRGWDYARSLEHVHNHIIENDKGQKFLDTRNM